MLVHFSKVRTSKAYWILRNWSRAVPVGEVTQSPLPPRRKLASLVGAECLEGSDWDAWQQWNIFNIVGNCEIHWHISWFQYTKIWYNSKYIHWIWSFQYTQICYYLIICPTFPHLYVLPKWRSPQVAKYPSSPPLSTCFHRGYHRCYCGWASDILECCTSNLGCLKPP